ncbi:proteinase-activated receptor 1-like [Ptychodera flava]
MLSISIERYLAVCRPLKFLDWCTVERARIVVLLSWLLSAVSFIPMATMTTSRVSLLTVPFDHEPNLSLTEYDDIDVRQVCMFVNDNNRTAAALYYVYVFAIFLVVPSIFVTFSYIKIFLHLRRQPPSRSDAEKVKDERKKLSRMMLCVLVVFIVSWLPYCILCIVAAFGGTMASDNVFFAYLLTLWLIFLGSALDPYIYSYYSASFRSQLKSILCCFCARRQRGEYEVKEGQQSGQAQGGAGTWTVKGLNQNSRTSQGDTSQTASVYENYHVTRGSDANASVESEVRAAVSNSDQLNGPGDTRSFSHTAPTSSPVSDTPPSESVDFYVRRQPSKETLV